MPAKAGQEYRWGRSRPRDPKPTSPLHVSGRLDRMFRKWELSNGRSANPRGAREAARGKAKVVKEMERAKEV